MISQITLFTPMENYLCFVHENKLSLLQIPFHWNENRFHMKKGVSQVSFWTEFVFEIHWQFYSS